MIKYRKIFTLSFQFIFFFFLFGILGECNENTIAYKLSQMHTKYLQPDRILTQTVVTPTPATIKEFEWIIDNLKYRSMNPETAIADTIVETWSILREKGYKISLLDVARALNKMASNSAIFGNEKVNFRMTSKYWLAQQLKSN